MKAFNLNQIRNLKATKAEQNDFVAMSVLVMLVFQVLLLGLFGIGVISLIRLSNKPAPSLVQVAGGEAIRVAPMDNQERTPEAIVKFVNDTLALMFNWSGTLPPEDPGQLAMPKPDPGVSVSSEGSNNKITTGAWQAAFALSTDFRSEFLQTLSVLTPQEIFNGNAQAVLIPRNTEAPQEIEPGKWKVRVVADLAFVDRSNNETHSIPFNKEIYVRSVTPPTRPLGESAGLLEQAAYNVRQAGIEIYGMRDLKKEDL